MVPGRHHVPFGGDTRVKWRGEAFSHGLGLGDQPGADVFWGVMFFGGFFELMCFGGCPLTPPPLLDVSCGMSVHTAQCAGGHAAVKETQTLEEAASRVGPGCLPAPHMQCPRFGGNVGEQGCDLAKADRDTLRGSPLSSLTWDEVIRVVCGFARTPGM